MLTLSRSSARKSPAPVRAVNASPASVTRLLMRLESVGMTEWWKRELVLTDEGLQWDIWRFEERVTMTLPYHRIQGAELVLGPCYDDLQIIGVDRRDNLLIRGLDREQALKLKAVIQRHIGRPASTTPIAPALLPLAC